jgi:hypothetical protein
MERDLKACFIESYDQLRPLLLAAQAPGFHAVAVSASWGVQTSYLPLEPSRSHHRIIGRHSDCHLRLVNDPAISLRHLLASAWMDEDGAPTLRLLDLGGEAPLRLEDGSLCTGLQADGSVLAGLRGYCLFFLFDDGQAWPHDAEAAWDSLGERVTASRAAQRRDGHWDRAVRSPLRLVSPPPSNAEGCTSLTATGTLLVRLGSPAALRDLSPSSEGAIGFLRLPDDRFVRLTPADLTRGVLVGRYDRCELTHSFSHNKTVSRVHLCLVLDPTGLWAIDVASSNGTWEDSERVEATRLGERARLTLGTANLVWELHGS